MTTDKTAIQYLAAICASRNITTAIISPGSRNAPLTIAFNRHPDINCISIVDERSAAFFALGIAQQTGNPVAIISTSGTAALNYASAIAEAYYQQIPLLILTADRPARWIDKGESQVIRQKNIYSNYINSSFELLPDPDTKENLDDNISKINSAIDSTILPKKGPVHINIPLEEPLYNLSEIKDLEIPGYITNTISKSPEIVIPELSRINDFSRIIILAGMITPDEELNRSLNKISNNDNIIVLTETNSNLSGQRFISSIDKVINSLSEVEYDDFKPDLLITIGHNVISKMVKSFIRNNKPKEHWHIDSAGQELDTYECLTSTIKATPVNFISQIKNIKTIESDYYHRWDKRRNDVAIKHEDFLKNAPYSDLSVFNIILKKIPDNSILQMGNSTVVRYIQLFKQNSTLRYYSNRGVSGIDGCTSTAAGAATAKPNDLAILISGDISFLYDSNALWNNHLPNNLRIIIINNSGGGIFRFLNGSSELEELEEFFETGYNINIGKLAEAHGISFNRCDELNTLDNCLDELFASKEISILEIKTPSIESAESLKKYFNFIK